MEEITAIIFEAINQINRQLDIDKQLVKSEAAVLYGPSGKLDSIGFVMLIVNIEQRLKKKYKKAITLTNEKAMSQKNSPFLSVRSLTLYIQKLLAEKR
ncbi:MAG: hypothetical protein HYZ85_05635 [Candidatus Omnitrophica bacterium]|nr:hypothetical protein [Candidatus Omnitrophota bacterium]